MSTKACQYVLLASIINRKAGAVAQLGERLPCTEEVRGSNPLSSTMKGNDITLIWLAIG